MEFFTSFRSKKTSEAGVWIQDDDVENCGCCGIRFAVLIRKHHCRQCGGIVCGACSENRKFLESSRSGAPKRVCDKCYANSSGSYGSAEAAGSAAGQVAADDDADDDGGDAMGRVRLEDDGGAQYPRRAAAPTRLPDVSAEEAVESLAAHPFEGRWQAILIFTAVDMLQSKVAAATEAANKLNQFKSIAVAGAKGTLNRDGSVKSGSKVRVFLDLETKGAAYFRGTCPEFGQFGVDGKVTGAIQRASGKINMTIQMVANKTTTSFNFVGLMNSGGVFSGTFSGCEISRQAGSVSGTFKIVKTTGTAAGGGGGGEEDAEEDAAAEAAAAARKKRAGGGKASKGSSKGKHGDDGSDSGGSDSEEEGRRKKKLAPTKKAARKSSGSGSDSASSGAAAAKRKGGAAAAAAGGKGKKAAAASESEASDDDSGDQKAKGKKAPPKRKSSSSSEHSD